MLVRLIPLALLVSMGAATAQSTPDSVVDMRGPSAKERRDLAFCKRVEADLAKGSRSSATGNIGPRMAYKARNCHEILAVENALSDPSRLKDACPEMRRNLEQPGLSSFRRGDLGKAYAKACEA